MEIKRKTNIIITTERKIVVPMPAAMANIICDQCAEKMLPAQTSAELLGLSSRLIYRLIEADSIHFIETAAREIYVCAESVRRVIRMLSDEPP